MAFITIITLPGGGKKTCSEYYFKSGVMNEKCSILPGEVVEVPDEELQGHLDTGLVMQVPSIDGVKKGGRPRSSAQRQPIQEGFDEVYATRR